MSNIPDNIRPELKAVYSALKSFSSFENDEDLIGFCLDCVVAGQSAIDYIVFTNLFNKLSYHNQVRVFRMIESYNNNVSNIVYDMAEIFKAEGYEV